MRKVLLFIFFIGIVLCLVFFNPVTTQAKTIELTYSNFFPPSHIQSKLAAAWCKEIEKKTHGKVKITYYPGQTLTKAKNCYDGVINDISDIGMSVLGYTRGRFPVMAAVDLPLGYTNGGMTNKVVNAVYNKFKPKEFDDTQVMYFTACGPGLLFTKSKPVKKLEDLKGMKIRGHGTIANMIKSLGAIPVAMPMPELYQALQKGVVEGAFYPMEVNKGWKMAEQVKYGTLAYSCAFTSSFFVVMNKKKWAALPPDIQKAIGEINKEWIVKHTAAWVSSDAEGKKYFLSKGGKLFKLDPVEAKRWKDASKPVIADYIAKMKKKGINGKEIVDYILSLLK
jgi:TRAP-type C4-dicarboxylate transport system substrate-binding protein